MYHPDAAHSDPDVQARERLARDFPGVPERIITAVFAAYRRVAPTPDAAFNAAHDRIADAAKAM